MEDVILILIIAAIAVCIAIGAYIKNDRSWRKASKAWYEANDGLHSRVCELVEERGDLKRKNEELCETRDILVKEKTELYAKCEKLSDENLRLTQENADIREASLLNRLLLEDFKIIEDDSGNRTCYMELDGMRLIVDGTKVTGWYDNNVPEVKRGEQAPVCSVESVAPFTNYRWIKCMTIEEMADLLENFEEYAAKSCDPKYCDCGKPDGACTPALEGMTRSEVCRVATVKWLMDLHEDSETEAGGKEGPGEERLPVETTADPEE